MKKILLTLILTTVVSLASLTAETGLGAALSYGFNDGANDMGGVLTINTPVIPGTVQTIRLSFNSSDTFHFAITDDWWIIQEPLTGQLDFYIGLGFYTGFNLSNGDADFSLGARAPLGLTIKPIDYLEFFLEVAPCMGLGFEPEVYFPAFDAQGALGFRLWF
ncbi:MAG: hypothetical protein PQJ60_05695 [Spirochaetales bacterium]|nr:hypothetical protein [Spirochaetales bacterium]